MTTGGNPLADDEELAFIAGLKEGDIVLHPEKSKCMRIVSIEEGETTTLTYDGGPERRTTEPWRRLHLLAVDLHPLERAYARPDWLDYNDIEERIRRKKRPEE